MNTRIFLALSIGLILSISDLFSQGFKYSIPGLDTLEQGFIIQGGASTVLRDGQTEIITNASLISYQVQAHQNGDNSPIIDRFRTTQFVTDLFAFHGFSTSGRFDLGVQIRYLRSRLDNSATSSPLKVFESEGDFSSVDPEVDPSGKLDNSFGAVAYAGPRFRFKPLLRRPEWVINGGFLFKTVDDEQEQNVLAADRNIFELGSTFYQSISSNVLYFLSGNFQVFLPGDEPDAIFINQDRDKALYNTNVAAYIIYRTNNRKWSIFPGLSYGVSFKPSEFDENNLIRTQDFLFAFGGIQYAQNNRLNIFASAGFPLQIDVKNPLVQITRQSYSLVSLGFRLGFL